MFPVAVMANASCRFCRVSASKGMTKLILTVAFDADDTLWHNERYFAEAQRTFEFLLADYVDAEQAAAVLLETEKRNIPIYGFGVKGFVLSMLEAASTLTNRQAPSVLNDSLLALGRRMMMHPVELLPGVGDVLQALHGRYRLMLITKGDLIHQERKIEHSGLSHVFDHVEIVTDKTADTYRRIFDRHGQGARRAMMVGNSLKSDVLPALEAGAFGVHVPHEFVFALEHADAPLQHQRFHALATLKELPALIERIDGTRAS
jgi:putative hydrolase of the HAD superfamily